MRLRIEHETIYSFAAPVTFGAWRLLMRPADSHSVRVVEATFELSPPGTTRWIYDAYSNSVCLFTPQGPSSSLRVVNHLVIDRFPAPLSPLSRDNPRSLMPIQYDAAALTVLAPFMAPVVDDADPAHRDWAQHYRPLVGEPALDYVARLTSAIHVGFRYTPRDAIGTQTPAQTVARGGTCRDLAWLMIETLRQSGFAARFVTGYLYAGEAGSGAVGGGATHAWCDVFLPDLGWIECDPTNGLIESSDLIRVASTRTPQEASPMDGIVFDNPGGEQLSVSVRVTQQVDDQIENLGQSTLSSDHR